jgi:hypothetical protein
MHGDLAVKTGKTMYFLCRVNFEIYCMDIIAESKSASTVKDLNGRNHRTHCKRHSIFHSVEMANSELQYLKIGKYAA